LLFALSCSNGSSSGSSGCGSSSTTATCDIDTAATTCPNEITLICHDGGKPFSKQCKQGLKQDTDVLYCCANDAEPDTQADEQGGGGS
jgi:hypothetical protein